MRVQEHIDNTTAFEGLGDPGSRRRQGNLFTNYRFTGGPLKGFNIGGGVRYLGPLSAGVNQADRSLVFGNSKTLYDLLLGYRTKLGERFDVKFQLNIRNLFDESDYTIAGLEGDGRLRAIALQSPREFQFRTTLSW
jgi:outer membrane receptor for monomeric catechols